MRIKGLHMGKEEIRAFSFLDDTTAYIKDAEEFIRRLLEVITTFSKMARYNINMQN